MLPKILFDGECAMLRDSSPGPLSSQVHRHAELMDRMIEALAIEGGAAVRLDCGRAFALARTQCLHCPNSRACEEWLAAARCPTCPPPFCEAAAFFRRLGCASEGALPS
jgi:hypothetical protein